MSGVPVSNITVVMESASRAEDDKAAAAAAAATASSCRTDDGSTDLAAEDRADDAPATIFEGLLQVQPSGKLSPGPQTPILFANMV